MRTKSGDEENYYKLHLNSINPTTATKAANWLKALQDVLNIQKNTGDSKGATATKGLLHFINRTHQVSEERIQQLL